MRKGSKIKLAALALAGLGVVMSSGAYAMGDGMKVSSQGGIKAMNTEADSHWFKLGGLVQLDQVFAHGNHNSHAGYPNSANVRRARFITEGGVGCHWSYYLGVDFAGPGVDWVNLYITYSGFENTSISVGQISPPIFLSNWIGTSEVTTMERPAVMQVFVPDDGLGVYADHQLEMLTFAAAVWQPKDGALSGGANDTSFRGSDLLGVSGRMTFSPIHTPDYVWHFGVSGAYQDLHDRDNVLTFSTRPEMRGRKWPSLVASQTFTNTAKSWSTAGVEAGALWGPFALQAEYVGARVNRLAGKTNEKYKGWYALATYNITGESKSYDFASGTFGNVVPASTTGAVEMFAQYSSLDLRDHNLGSLEHDTTAGVNWYLNKNLKFTAEYSRANLGRLASETTPKRELDLFGLRFQAKWG